MIVHDEGPALLRDSRRGRPLSCFLLCIFIEPRADSVLQASSHTLDEFQFFFNLFEFIRADYTEHYNTCSLHLQRA